MLKKKLETKRAELEALQAGVEAGNAEDVATAKSLISEIKDLQAAIDAAEKSGEILASLKSVKQVEKASGKARSIGEAAVAAFKSAGWTHANHEIGREIYATFKDGEGSDTPAAGDPPAAGDTPAAGDDPTPVAPVSGYTYTERVNSIITLPKRELVFADLFGSETINGTSREITVEKPIEGDFEVVAEGGKKPQMTTDFTTKTVTLKKIAGIIKLTDEYLDDAPALVENINGRLYDKLKCKEEDELVSDLLAEEDLQTLTYDPEVDNALAEAVFKAMTLIKVNANRNANAVVLNPYDYMQLRLAKDGAGQYYGGGYFQGEYGNGTMALAQPLWGIPTFVSTAVEQGSVIVGDFKGASVLRRNGIKFASTISDTDDFQHDLVSLRLEERFALAVNYPLGFCLITADDGD